MANTILTPTALTRESLALLRNSLTFTKGCNRDWSKEFANEGNKINDIVNVRVPAMYSGAEGATLVTQDHIEQKFPVKLTTQFHVGVNFSSGELT